MRQHGVIGFKKRKRRSAHRHTASLALRAGISDAATLKLQFRFKPTRYPKHKHNFMSENPQETPLPVTARTLLSQNQTGALATFSTKHPGFPFTSVATYSVSPNGEPIFFFSSMARHSKNLRSNPNASLLVNSKPAAAAQGGALAAGRVTVMGTIKPVDKDDIEMVAQGYLAANPEAAQWLSFGDFQFYRMEIVDVYVVAGFGAMGWVNAEQLAEAEV